MNREPSWDVEEPRALLLGQLAGLTGEQLRARVLPSGWTPLELLNHLVQMERRWLQWGFVGELLARLTTELAEVGRRTERIAGSADLTTRAQPGGRFGDRRPTLGWILLHVLQEYARHLGQLDAVRELLDGSVGE